MSENQKLSYSYHNFIYPFRYHYKNGEANQQEIDSILKESGFESEASFISGEEQYDNQFEEQYNIHQYLFSNARPNVLNLENSSTVSQQFIYQLDNSEHATKSQYHIILRNPYVEENGQTNFQNKGEKERTISLKVKHIKLVMFYKMKIGILSIETEFDGSNKPVYSNGVEVKEPFDKVCIINDYGRRVFSPVYDVKNDFMPEKLILDLYQKDTHESRKIVTDFTSKDGLLYIGKNDATPKLIDELVNGFQKDKLKIESILDDRMFVTYVIRDNVLSDYYRNVDSIENENLYRFAFCDAFSCTCQENNMLVDKLNEHTYRRWKNYGTLYTATEYSFGCITGEQNTEKSVVIPFRTIYTEMVKLALAQRAAMVNIESDAGKISIKFSANTGSGTENKKQLVEEIREIWQKYVIFQNELYMPEITFQEQGVEIYAMLKRFLKLQEQNDYLMDELNNLHEVAELINDEIDNENSAISAEHDKEMNNAINLLTVAGIAFAIASMAQDYLADIDFIEEKINDGVWLKNAVLYCGGFLSMFVVLIFSMRGFLKKIKGKNLFEYLFFSIVILAIVFFMFFLK